MANRSLNRRLKLSRTFWAWWVCLALLAGTAGWFWLLGHDLRIERKKEPASPTTAKATH
ncbi:MAG: hypothetical protein JWO89_2377 [Verrucomicrobiaceae bacterium]|nr:hypothetical protein [Verrucomicrobiaceae bacterium]